MTDYPDIPPHLLAKADQVKAARPAVRLVYAEDLVQGMVVLVDKPCDNPLASLFGAAEHDHGTEQRTILEVRTAGDIVSIILMGEDGEQYPMASHRLGTHKIIPTVRPT
jgi:hypothetical protein